MRSCGFPPSSQSLIKTVLSTLPKVGAGPTAVSHLYIIYITRSSSPPSFQGSPTDVIQIESISVSPDPPKPGQDLTVTVQASAQKEIEVRSQAPITYTTH